MSQGVIASCKSSSKLHVDLKSTPKNAKTPGAGSNDGKTSLDSSSITSAVSFQRREVIFRCVGLLSWNLDIGSRFSDQSSEILFCDFECWCCLREKVLNDLKVSLRHDSCALV